MSKQIKFIPMHPHVKDLTPNQLIPSSKGIPDWWRKTKPTFGPQEVLFDGAATNFTVKKCVPFLDALTTGYLFVLQQDVIVMDRPDNPELPFLDWKAKQMTAVTDHSTDQIGEIEFSVGVDLERVPYAAIVEFGSGTRTNTPWEKSRAYGMTFDTGSAVPMDFPFEAPDVPYNRDDPYSLQGYPKFSGFVGHIERWMKVKNIQPEKGSVFISAVAIAAAIIDHGNYAHPYLRPAWFDTELAVKQGAKNALRNATR